MAKWRKKPVVIDAWPWPEVPEGAPVSPATSPASGQQVQTLEGYLTRSRGDWLIRGVNGEYYPCKPDIFQKTYEPAEGRDG